MNRSLGDDHPELSQMAAQGVNQLRALPDETLMSSKSDGPRLPLDVLDSDAMHVGTQHCLGDRSSIGGIVPLPLDERLNVNRWDQPDVVSEPLSKAA